MARDYTKYQVEGIDGVFGKGKLVLAVVQDYCSKNECTFDELKAAFPDEAQGGNTGVFGTLLEAQEIAKKRARHYVNDKIILKDAIIVVSNQWGDNLPLFIEKAEEVGYTISTEDSSNSGESDSENENNSDTKHYTYINVYNNENSGEDFLICNSIVAQTNGKYTLYFHFDSDGDGVIDTYNFYDIKTKVSGLNNGSPWDFEEFTDINEEYTEHNSLEDFGYDGSEIAETLESMRSEFIKKYLNEASQENFYDNAAVPFDKRDILKKEIEHDGNLVFEDGDKNILPDVNTTA
jgi:hypothetical protein